MEQPDEGAALTFGIDYTDISHMAIVVDDLDVGMQFYADALGLSWAHPWSGEIEFIERDVRRSIAASFTYSTAGPPHVELIQSVPGTLWQPTSGIHHIGVWVEDLVGEINALSSRGFRTEVVSHSSGFAYMQASDGTRIELADAASQPDFARWVGGGHL